MTSVDHNIVAALQLQLSDLLEQERESRRSQGLSPLDGETKRQHGRGLIERVVQRHEEVIARADGSVSNEEHIALVRALEARLFGAGPLQPLLDDEGVENVDINGFDEVFITYTDGTQRAGEPIGRSDDELIDIVRDLASMVGLSSRPFDPANPEVDIRLPDGSRLSAVQSLSSRPAVSIRRNTLVGVTLKDLIANGTMDDDLASFLRALVQSKMNVIIAGGTDAGKTTLLRAMASVIHPSERIITVERSLELGLKSLHSRHPNVVEFEERLPNSDGAGAVSLAQLVRRSTRMNPSRVIVGEVLGDEVITMLNAMSQGNDGSLSTIHARYAAQTLHRLSTYALQAPEQLPIRATNMLVAGAVDFIVYVRKPFDPGGGSRRIVDSVIEINGINDAGDVMRSTVWSTPDGRTPAVRNNEVAIERMDALEAFARVGGWDV